MAEHILQGPACSDNMDAPAWKNLPACTAGLQLSPLAEQISSSFGKRVSQGRKLHRLPAPSPVIAAPFIGRREGHRWYARRWAAVEPLQSEYEYLRPGKRLE